MAVQSDTSRIQYAGNNSTSTSYAVPFVFLESSHLKAIARTSAGVESVVTLTNHTGAGNVNGGTVRTAVAVPATSTLTIYREVPATQTTVYQEGGDFPAASHERALDKLTQISQQNQRQIGSSLRLSEATQIAPLPLPLASGQHVLATAGNGTAPSFQSLGSLSIGPVIATGSTTPRSVQDRFADVVNVKDFGAVGDGVTDDTAAIQAAIDAVQTAGGVVQFPSGVFKITDTLTVTGNNVVLRGSSGIQHAAPSMASDRWTAQGGTIIVWGGGTDNTKRMILIGPPPDGTRGSLGCGVRDMVLDAAAEAGYGLEILSLRGGAFKNLAVADATNCNIRVNVQSSANWQGPPTSQGIRDTQHLVFEDVVSRSWLDGAKDAIGIAVGGDNVADTAACLFNKITVIHRDNTGLLIESSGSCLFSLLFFFRVSKSDTVTISNASPAEITWNNHGLVNNKGVIFTTTGSLPSGIEGNRLYYVRNATTNTFRLSEDYEGTIAVNTSTAGSGAHTAFGGGLGILVKGSTGGSAEQPSGHHFSFVEPHLGGMTFSNGTYPSSRCVVSNFGTSNASPRVNLSSKVQAVVTTGFGAHQMVAIQRPAITELTRADIGTVTNSQLSLGAVHFYGRNDSDVPQLFAAVDGGLYNNNSGSLVGQLRLITISNAGANQVEVGVRNGLVLGAAGSFYGLGTINATAYHLAGVSIRSGTGSPESNVTAPIGSVWLRTDGSSNTTLYIKESGAGNTGWVAK